MMKKKPRGFKNRSRFAKWLRPKRTRLAWFRKERWADIYEIEQIEAMRYAFKRTFAYYEKLFLEMEHSLR